jgi:transcriptional regulator of arginine metabolism
VKGENGMKFQRQNMILQLIEEEKISTQKELTERLEKAGCEVTQATVSRDIKELRLIKVMGEDGRTYYSVTPSDSMGDFAIRFRNIFRESVLKVDQSNSIVVIKTLTGVASAAAAAVDSMSLPQIVGSLAGDDTIFLVMRSEDVAKEFCEELKQMIK